MSSYSFAHLSNCALLSTTKEAVAQERAHTARLIALLAEIDTRRLFAPAGYSSMHEFCVRELGLSEDAACRRIRAARAARDFPIVLSAMADGRLHLSGVVALAPYLSPGTIEDLLKEASNQPKNAIERLLARRFPQPDVPTRIQVIAASVQPAELEYTMPQEFTNASAPARMITPDPSVPTRTDAHEISEPDATPAPGPAAAPSMPRPKVAPLAAERFSLQMTMSQEMHDKLRHAQSLLRHRLPSGDIVQVLELALDTLIAQLERRKFGATQKPRKPKGKSSSARYIPNYVKRAVRERDEGRCTFVGEDGRRCRATDFLEFDHVDPVARGGQATIEGLRLRCRTHNQLEAERTFGAGFMQAKRQESGSRAAR